MTPQLESLALDIFKAGCFRDSTHREAIERPNGERGFEVKDHEENPAAPLSPFYLMLRTPDNPGKPGQLTPDLVRRCSEAMAELVQRRHLGFDRIVGLPNAGKPFADTFPTAHFPACRGRLGLQKTTTNGKRHITGPVEGNYNRGEDVLMIDDVVTMAGSKFEALEVLTDAGLVVPHLVVVVDRKQDGADTLRNKTGCLTHALWSIYELLTLYRVKECISPEMYTSILIYFQAT